MSCTESYDTNPPEDNPFPPPVSEKRLTIDLDAWNFIWAIWIRSWFGNDNRYYDSSFGDRVTRTQADEAYALLKERVFCPLERIGKIDDKFAGSCIFEDDELDQSLRDVGDDSDMEVMGDVLSIVLSALMQCPDALGRTCENAWRRWCAVSDEEGDLDQALVAVVVDGVACEEGRVLMVSLNHKGQVLCAPERCELSELGLDMTSWRHRRGSLYVAGAREDEIDQQVDKILGIDCNDALK